MIERFVLSIRKYYPNIKIIIGDQNPLSEEMRDLFSSNSVERIQLAYDCGVGVGRSECATRAKTDYVLLCDDDFVFTAETDLDVPGQILAENPNIGVVGGALNDIWGDIDGHNVRELRRFEKYIFVDRERKFLITVPIDYLSPRAQSLNGHVFYECDMTLNWALIRREVLTSETMWDSRYRSNGEHESFFLNLKYLSSTRVVYCPDFVCDHNHVSDNTYQKRRHRQNGWGAFGRSQGFIDHLEIGVGLHRYDNYESLPWSQRDISLRQSGTAQLPIRDDSYLRLLPSGRFVSSENYSVGRIYEEGVVRMAQADAPERMPADIEYLPETVPLQVNPTSYIFHQAVAETEVGAPKLFASQLERQFHKYRSLSTWSLVLPILKIELEVRRFLKRKKMASK